MRWHISEFPWLSPPSDVCPILSSSTCNIVVCQKSGNCDPYKSGEDMPQLLSWKWNLLSKVHRFIHYAAPGCFSASEGLLTRCLTDFFLSTDSPSAFNLRKAGTDSSAQGAEHVITPGKYRDRQETCLSCNCPVPAFLMLHSRVCGMLMRYARTCFLFWQRILNEGCISCQRLMHMYSSTGTGSSAQVP